MTQPKPTTSLWSSFPSSISKHSYFFPTEFQFSQIVPDGSVLIHDASKENIQVDRFVSLQPESSLELEIKEFSQVWHTSQAFACRDFSISQNQRNVASIENFAQNIVQDIDGFFDEFGDSVKERDLVHFFYALGQKLYDSYKKFSFLSQDEYFAKISQIILEENEPYLQHFKANSIDLTYYFSPESLKLMQRMTWVFPQEYLEYLLQTIGIVTKSVWAHITELVTIDDPYERIYYAEMSVQNKWNVTQLRENKSLQRFHTHTVVRQSKKALHKALLDLSQGNQNEWVYRDLIRLDFLKLDDETFQNMHEERDLEPYLMKHRHQISQELGGAFTVDVNQKNFQYQNRDGEIKTARIDVIGQVNDGESSYPFVIELKKGAFTKSVLEQCQKYRALLRGVDDDGFPIPPGYLKPNEDKVMIMAFVTKFDHQLSEIMKLGLGKNGHRSSIFVALYTYKKPPQEFLEKAIGEQLSRSERRAEIERERLKSYENFYKKPKKGDYGDFGYFQGFFQIRQAKQQKLRTDLPFE